MSFNKEIAHTLERVREVSKLRGGNIIHSSDISRGDRELLVRTQWLQPIIKGWYMLIKPEVMPGESSHWYANFWKFIATYLEHHYGKEYCLSAENSLDVHTDCPTIPQQVIVIVSKGGGAPVHLPFQTSVFPYKDTKNLPESRVEKRGLQIMEIGDALCKVTPSYFNKSPQKAEIALRLIPSADQLLEPILRYGLKNAAARLIGAYHFLKDDQMATLIQKTLKTMGIHIKPENPFNHPIPLTNVHLRSPYRIRIASMWENFREIIIKNFPEPSEAKMDKEDFIAEIEATYERDAYHSLSIEGFDVDEDLITRVKNNQWNPNHSFEDQEKRNALAARGYYEAFNNVENTILKILEEGNPGKTIEKELPHWYQSLFAPSVRAGLLKPTDLLGYRKHAVYIRNSRHIPPQKEALIDSMEAFFSCLKGESHPAVRALLGHFIFVFIHPYMDGNGRLGRFLMNAMLVTGGYPWTIIHLKNRREYLSALERASVDNDIKPFVKFIAKEAANRR